MAKPEIADFVRTLEKKRLWPLIWLYGPERMRARELQKRIRKLALGTEISQPGNWNEMTFEGAATDADEVQFEANSMSLGGGTKLVWVKDAHLLQNADALLEIAGNDAPLEELQSVVICLSPSLDARKSFVKSLFKGPAPAIHCAEIELAERARWIRYLAKTRNLAASDALVAALENLDPWSLDRVDSELSKVAIFDEGTEGATSEDALSVLSLDASAMADGFQWTDAFWARDLSSTLPSVSGISSEPDRALPLLGLLASQLRQIRALARGEKITAPDFIAAKLRKNLARWKEEELAELERALGNLDFDSKQTAKLSLGHWTELVTRFGGHPNR